MSCNPVTFSYSTWTATFPELASVPEAQADIYFQMAEYINRNDGTGPVSDPGLQLTLLNLVTAHLATLYTQSLGDQSPGSAKPANSPVGRINSASEGSVSVQTDYGTNISQQMAYMVSTKYGAQWWFMTAIYRKFRYVPGQLQSGQQGLGYGGYGFGGFPGYGGFR